MSNDTTREDVDKAWEETQRAWENLQTAWRVWDDADTFWRSEVWEYHHSSLTKPETQLQAQ